MSGRQGSAQITAISFCLGPFRHVPRTAASRDTTGSNGSIGVLAGFEKRTFADRCDQEVEWPTEADLRRMRAHRSTDRLSFGKSRRQLRPAFVPN
jgi:hypothetical protein